MKALDQILNKFEHILKKSWFIYLVATFYTLVVLAVLLNRFWQYEAFYYDQGLFERSIWLVSQFKAPIIDHHILGRTHHFADHFFPSLFVLFSPFYWFTSKYETTLVALSIYTGLSVIIAYKIAVLKIKNIFMTYALLVSYMGYVGLQNALIFYIHPITAMLLPLMLLFWSLIKEKWKLFFMLLVFNLGFQETVATLGISLGLFMVLHKKSWRVKGIIVFLVSLFYGFAVMKLIIPYFSQGKFLYSPMFPTSIFDFFRRFIEPEMKVRTVFYSLLTFGFLPVLAPATLPMLLQDIILRFVLSGGTNQRWDMGLHYNANLAVLLFISSVFGYHRLEKFKFIKGRLPVLFSILIITIVLYIHQFIYHGPFGLAYNPEFYRHTKRQGFMNEFINKIPKEGKVMVQNNIAVFFTHSDLYILDGYEKIKKVKPDVIALDFRPGQNASNFWPMYEIHMRPLAEQLGKDDNYKILYNDDSRYIFTRKHD